MPWKALGYPSWREYEMERLGISQPRVYQLRAHEEFMDQLLGQEDQAGVSSTMVENDQPPERQTREIPRQDRAEAIEDARRRREASCDSISGTVSERGPLQRRRRAERRGRAALCVMTGLVDEVSSYVRDSISAHPGCRATRSSPPVLVPGVEQRRWNLLALRGSRPPSSDDLGVTIHFSADACARAGLSELDQLRLSAAADGVTLPSPSPAVARQIALIHQAMRRRGQTPSPPLALPPVSASAAGAARADDDRVPDASALVRALRSSHRPTPRPTSQPATAVRAVDSDAEIARLTDVHAKVFKAARGR